MDVEIPSSRIDVSSLSSIMQKDVPRIVDLAKARWNELCVNEHLKNTNTPLIAVGISNPHDLWQKMHAGVPIVHLQRECEALQGAQKRRAGCVRHVRAIQFLGCGCLWGTMCAWMSRKQSLPRCPATVGGYAAMVAFLSLCTARLMHALRLDYSVVTHASEHFLIRDDVVRNKRLFAVQTWTPFGCIALAAFCCMRSHVTQNT